MPRVHKTSQPSEDSIMSLTGVAMNLGFPVVSGALYDVVRNSRTSSGDDECASHRGQLFGKNKVRFENSRNRAEGR